MIFGISHEVLRSAIRLRIRFESALHFQKATRGRPHTGGQAMRTSRSRRLRRGEPKVRHSDVLVLWRALRNSNSIVTKEKTPSHRRNPGLPGKTERKRKSIQVYSCLPRRSLARGGSIRGWTKTKKCLPLICASNKTRRTKSGKNKNREKIEKSVDAFLAFPLEAAVHIQIHPLQIIHEKELHFAISLL
jgi:hypothetical protein